MERLAEIEHLSQVEQKSQSYSFSLRSEGLNVFIKKFFFVNQTYCFHDPPLKYIASRDGKPWIWCEVGCSNWEENRWR